MFSADQRRGRPVPGGRAINQNKEQILEMFNIFMKSQIICWNIYHFTLYRAKSGQLTVNFAIVMMAAKYIFFMIYTND